MLCACGAPATQVREEAPAVTTGAPSGGEAEAQALDVESIAPVIGGIIEPSRLEPRVLTPIALSPQPAVPARVLLAHLALGPGEAFRPPSGPCQDVLVLVREGELRAVGTGIAPPQAPGTIYAGDAVRFGPEGDGLLQNVGDTAVRTIVAYTRPDAPPSLEGAPAEGEGCDAAGDRDPRFLPIRSASVRSTPAHPAYGGALRVHILLDEDGAGARYGGVSVLEGDPSLTIPEHRHEDAAEILYVEDGSGVARVGERELAVRPGAALYIPPGELHDLRSDGTRPFRAIQVHTPSGPEQRFRARNARMP